MNFGLNVHLINLIQDNDNVVISFANSEVSQGIDPIIYLRDSNRNNLAIYQAWNNDNLVRLDIPSKGIMVL